MNDQEFFQWLRSVIGGMGIIADAKEIGNRKMMVTTMNNQTFVVTVKEV